MALRVWITEFAAIRVEAAAPIAQLSAITAYQPVLDITTGIKTSAAFGKTTRYIRIISEEPCIFRVGGNPTGNEIYLPAFREEYFGVEPGKTISVIASP